MKNEVTHSPVRSKLKVGQLTFTREPGKDAEREKEIKVVWPCGEMREKVLWEGELWRWKWEEEERKTQEKVEGLHKRRPESCGTGRR